MDQDTTWPAVLRRLANDIDVRTYAEIIDPLELQGIENGVIYLMAPTDLVATQVENTHGDEIAEACRMEMGLLGDLKVICEGKTAAPAMSPSTPPLSATPGMAWREYLKQVRETFLRCLNRHIPIRKQLHAHERACIQSLYERRVPIEKVNLGILRTFERAVRDNRAVTSFRYCIYQIEAAVRERRD